MRILLVGGLSKGVGKTTLVRRLLETLPDWGALKLTPVRAHACSGGAGCPECHGLSGDHQILLEGEGRSGWLLAREAALGAGIAESLRRMGGLPGLIVEGNSFVRHGAPDAIVVLAREGRLEVKTSARDLIPRADWVVLNRPADAAEARDDTLGLLRAHGATRIVELDAELARAPATAAFLAEVRAWSRS